jgi:[ribulose-bisphosphate carboxylase]-lysine N-methyltransferase
MVLFPQERARGADSAWAPYLAALPSTPPTPLCWHDAELAALKGTTLADAVAAQRRGVAASWARLAPLAHAAARAAGVASPALDEADMAWATGVFWSRALAFPDLASLSAAAPDAPPTPLAEGIVPGLDFCNHTRGAPARWTLLGARASKQQPGGDLPTTLALQESGRAPPLRRGAEVRISYGGGRPNEELLFCYGFAEAGNEDDALMLSPPVPPPADWDVATAARMALLHACGLAPRVFLPLAALRGATAAGTPAQAIEGAFACASGDAFCMELRMLT